MIRTLIVDSDPTVHEALASVCDALELVWTHAADGPSCFERLRGERPGLLVVDAETADLDLAQLLAMLRPRASPMPAVIVLSNRGDAFESIDMGQRAVLDVLPKPLEPAALRRAVERVMRLLELEQSLSNEQRDLESLRHNDPVTGLGAFSALRESLARRYVACARRGQPLSCAILSDEAYDSLLSEAGRAPGDARLVRIARSLTSVLEKRDGHDEVYRVDAAEFVVLLPGLDGAAAHRALEDMVGAVRRELESETGSTRQTLVVCGFASTPHPELLDAESLFRAANVALVRARERGRTVRFEAF